MWKGDLRKQQILETAEKMFCANGYEKTSVQDILDVIHLSKGSFYHHYDSKELLLKCICDKRAQASAEQLKTQQRLKSGIDGVNQVLSAMIPFNGTGLQFLTMIIPVYLLPEGQNVFRGYQEALKQVFLPLLMDSFDSALGSHEMFSEDPEFTAGICLDMTNDLWYAVIGQMSRSAGKEDDSLDYGKILSLLEQYRNVLEKILTAPFGSLHLIGLEDLKRLEQEMSSVQAAKSD